MVPDESVVHTSRDELEYWRSARGPRLTGISLLFAFSNPIFSAILAACFSWMGLSPDSRVLNLEAGCVLFYCISISRMLYLNPIYMASSLV